MPSASKREPSRRAAPIGRPVALLLLTLSLIASGCISVTPPPETPGPSVNALPTGVVASADPSDAPAASEPATPAPPPSAAPTAVPTATTASPSPAVAGASPLAASPATSPDPAASPSITPRPRPTALVLTPGPDRPRALAETEVYGFLPYWELDMADTLDLDQLTTLAWFGVEANARGALVKETNGAATPGWAGWTSDTWRALQARAQAQDVRVVFTVQRFSWTEGQRRRTIRLLQDPVARMRLTAQVMDVITEAGADGVNLDFEPMPAEVSADFTQLVREMRAAMNAVDTSLQLTFDVMPGIEGYDVSALTADDAADALFVMGYEYLTGASARTGSNAPLDKPEGQDLAGDIERILSLVPPGRVILGLPWYGRAWSTTGPDARAQTRNGDRWPFSVTILYRDAIAQAARTGRFYDEVEESAWTLYPSRVEDCSACRVTWRQLWYDDIDATRVKVEYAQDQELRGVGFWALGYQGAGDEMWSVLRLTLGGETDRRAPSGTATLDPVSVDGERRDLPTVTGSVRLLLDAADGQGSGVAFVRVGTTGATDDDGQLRDGTTYVATSSVTVDPRSGGPVYDLTPPRRQQPTRSPPPTATPTPSTSAEPSLSPSPAVGAGSPTPTASPATAGSPPVAASPSAPPPPSASPSPSSAPTAEPTPEPTPAEPVGRRVLRIQWRDVAGNWSEPVEIAVWVRGGTRPGPSPTPGPATPAPSEPPFVPGESPSVEESEEPEPSGSPSPA